MSETNSLYDRDFSLWIKNQATAIKNQDINAMDWDNLLEEVEDMGKSEKRSLESYTLRLIEHIFKICYWEKEKERNQKHWKKEVSNFRFQIQRILKRNPSLKKYLEENFAELLSEAKFSQSLEFDIPDNATLSMEKILDKEFFG